MRLGTYIDCLRAFETRHGRLPFQVHVSRRTWENILVEIGLGNVLVEGRGSMHGAVLGVPTFVERTVPDDAVDFLSEDAEGDNSAMNRTP